MISQFVDWSRFDRDIICEYRSKCDSLLQHIDFCDHLGCSSDHSEQLDQVYDSILSFISEATSDYIFVRKKNFVPVSGWNKNCKELHEKARRIF